jgi:hypothetical protein
MDLVAFSMGCCIVIAFMGIKISFKEQQQQWESNFEFDGGSLLSWFGARVSVCARNVVFFAVEDFIRYRYGPQRPPVSFFVRAADVYKFFRLTFFGGWPSSSSHPDREPQPEAAQVKKSKENKSRRGSNRTMTASLLHSEEA